MRIIIRFQFQGVEVRYDVLVVTQQTIIVNSIGSYQEDKYRSNNGAKALLVLVTKSVRVKRETMPYRRRSLDSLYRVDLKGVKCWSDMGI